MSALLVTYDLMSSGQNYAGVDRYLESFPTHWRFLRSAWIISTAKSTALVRDEIWSLLDSNDKLFVIDITGDVASWIGFAANDQWLQNTITRG